jgi:hypothetical protein
MIWQNKKYIKCCEIKKNILYLHSLLERPVRLGVRTGDFHSSNRGSIPLRATTRERLSLLKVFFVFITPKLLILLHIRVSNSFGTLVR